ncbi:ComF family protein [Siculibacillus lacustris]|uniref:ComF family protein n=2 Tax=Siculibacillus lacustris TaxID=1549641 RepID=A0A4Q9VW15_9HYPH|nr:ComF family protein [Siculibacillus lacustris]
MGETEDEADGGRDPRWRRLARAVVAGGRSAVGGLVDLIVPPVCLACRRPVARAHGLCGACWARLTPIERPYCERLGIPFGYDIGPGALSAEAIASPPVFDRARAAVIFDDVARDLVHGLKYHDRTEAAPLIGRMTARAGRDLLIDAEVIVPLPLHRRRLWTRKFNQAALIALEVGRASGVAVDVGALIRIRATRPQVGLGEAERIANVRGAFRVPASHRAAIEGRRVVLVDDVLTTGATVSAATRALRRAGALRIDVLTFARVAPGGAITI